jgi:AspT/YidE/YbjL antiporter-like protein
MELFRNLFEGYPNLWGGGVAHSVLILSLVIAFGIMLGKIKVAGISLGVTWILFVGIVFGHFNLNLDEHLLHFLKEFGLILFVYSVGLQVGPGFFSAFKKGGFTLNLLAMMVVFLGVTITIILHFITGVPITTMVGILSGAVTNTPGLGAAQQANSDLNGIDAPEINLRDTDLVNMPMACYADADVILVADIDRGGVFASVYGSVMLQTPEDKKRIKGVIINLRSARRATVLANCSCADTGVPPGRIKELLSSICSINVSIASSQKEHKSSGKILGFPSRIVDGVATWLITAIMFF